MRRPWTWWLAWGRWGALRRAHGRDRRSSTGDGVTPSEEGESSRRHRHPRSHSPRSRRSARSSRRGCRETPSAGSSSATRCRHGRRLLGRVRVRRARRPTRDGPRRGRSGWLYLWTWFPRSSRSCLVVLSVPGRTRAGPRRWRPVLWARVAFAALVVVGAASPGPDRRELPGSRQTRSASTALEGALDRRRRRHRRPCCVILLATLASVVVGSAGRSGDRAAAAQVDARAPRRSCVVAHRRHRGRPRHPAMPRSTSLFGLVDRSHPGRSGRRDAPLPALRDRPRDLADARLRRADGDARRRVRRARARGPGGVLVVRRRLEPRDRRLDARRRGAVPAAAVARAAVRRPALLPPPLRRAAHARGASARGCASRSTSRRSSRPRAASSTRRCSRRTSRSGCGRGPLVSGARRGAASARSRLAPPCARPRRRGRSPRSRAAGGRRLACVADGARSIAVASSSSPSSGSLIARRQPREPDRLDLPRLGAARSRSSAAPTATPSSRSYGDVGWPLDAVGGVVLRLGVRPARLRRAVPHRAALPERAPADAALAVACCGSSSAGLAARAVRRCVRGRAARRLPGRREPGRHSTASMTSPRSSDSRRLMCARADRAPAAVASIVVRFRRSRGVERQQLKWLACAGSVVVDGVHRRASSVGRSCSATSAS